MDQLRISDADREAAVNLLGEQYAVGRLTREELDERSDAVWSARTQGDLAPIFADLPTHAAGPARGRPRPASLAPHRRRWWPIPLAPLLAALVVLTVLTHLPFVLLFVVLFLCFRWRHARWRR